MEVSMKPNRRTVLLKAALFGCLFSLPARSGFAQQASNPARSIIRGTIESKNAQEIVVKTAEGTTASVALASDTVITTNIPASLNSIKAGDFVASAAAQGVDGKLHSTDLRIFPEAMRGLGEGQRPMDKPKMTMTNASVSEVVAAPEGRVLTVRFKDGMSELVVVPDVPVTEVVISDISVLRPGMPVEVITAKSADGIVTAKRIMTN
jgi:propanediol dehydratase small subunit